MNKKELTKLYKEMSLKVLTLEEAKKEVKIFTKTLEEALVIEGKIKFQNIGVFEVFSRQPKVISNPATGERMKIYPKKTVKFRVSKMLSK